MNSTSIAVAVDGSPASAAALGYAAGVARAQHRRLAGIFVLDTGWADFIGSDWQSACGARQGFLDDIRRQLEAQADSARRQFAEAASDLGAAEFTVVPGDPLEALCELMERGDTAMLVAGREVFQVCGRPSVKTLARDLQRRVRRPLVIL